MVKDLCFEIIEKCTNNCQFCSSNSNCNKTQIIDLDTFKKVIDHFMQNGGIEELSLSGGEPLLHPNILEMVKYAKSYGIRTVIFTSGVVFGKPLQDDEIISLTSEMNTRLDEVAEDDELTKNSLRKFYQERMQTPKFAPIDRNVLHELALLGLDKIVFDMQAYNDETDSLLMVRGTQSHYALLKSLIDATFEQLNTDVHFVPMKPNYLEIKDLIELLEIAGVNQISFLNFVPQGRGKKNASWLKLSDEERIEFFSNLEEVKNSFSGNIRVGIPFNGEETHKCNAGIEKLDIKFDGTVLPCPAFKELTKEECEKFHIKLPNIYKDLDIIRVLGKGTRTYQLCKQIYTARNTVSN